jgi:hypothetical protein
MVFIFNYEREEMFTQVLNHLKHLEPVVLDDGSSYLIDYPNVIRFRNGGKKEFWKKWFVAFELAKASDDDLFIFMPNDFMDLDLDLLHTLHEKYKRHPYLCNIINDGREWCWIQKPSEPVDQYTKKVYFTDCGFFCNRKALERINFTIDPIDPKRFVNRRDISSGVGQQLTMKFNRNGVKMLLPIKSLAKHGDHESVMHGDLRKENPLISR